MDIYYKFKKDTDMELIKLTEDKKALFIEMNQEAFQRGFEAYFGKTSQTIIPKKDIIASLNAAGSHAYLALKDGEVVGGVCVVVDESTSVNDLHLLFVKPENQSKGAGFGIWSAVLQLHPAAKWKTCTPYFDKRNIYFYLNKCKFKIVKFVKNYNPNGDSTSECSDFVGDGGEGMFEFERES